MTKGIKIDYGNKLGKTIIFAKNHDHAEKILEVFNKEYPHLPGFAKVIDNYMTYAQSAIDEFSDPKKLPQIAISVDMLEHRYRCARSAEHCVFQESHEQGKVLADDWSRYAPFALLCWTARIKTNLISLSSAGL